MVGSGVLVNRAEINNADTDVLRKKGDGESGSLRGTSSSLGVNARKKAPDREAVKSPSLPYTCLSRRSLIAFDDGL